MREFLAELFRQAARLVENSIGERRDVIRQMLNLAADLAEALSGAEALRCLLISLVALPVLGLAGYLVYRLFSAPLRRQERARLVLDLIELGLERGETPERTLIEAADLRERRLGRPLRRLGALLREGLRLGAALELTPGLVPPAVAAMLRAGDTLGNLRLALPAARRLLSEGLAQVSHAHHYLVVLVFVTTPAWVVTFGALAIWVLPGLQRVVEDLEGEFSGLLAGLLAWRVPLLAGQLALLGALWGVALVYCAGPRMTRWLAHRLGLDPDRWALRLPWRRRRLQRDFTTLLAAALDAGLPEPQALALAGAGTDNAVWRERARMAETELARGVKLPEALAGLDETGELRWRLANGAFGRGGFLAALAGWREALEARAFRDEQVSAQLLTTGLVLLNGGLVTLLTVGVFQVLVNFIQIAVLW
jgi:type II secretory pathway component PulF